MAFLGATTTSRAEPSDESDNDGDYQPSAEGSSDEDSAVEDLDSDQDATGTKEGGRRRKRQRLGQRRRANGAKTVAVAGSKAADVLSALTGQTAVDAAAPVIVGSETNANAAPRPEVTPAAVIVSKARVDSLWAELNARAPARRPSSASASSATTPMGGVNDLARVQASSKAAENPSNAGAASTQPTAKPPSLPVAKTYRFAGEDVRVDVVHEAPSSSTSRALGSAGLGQAPPAAAKKKSGLDDLLGTMGKKDKLNIIEKSKLDWSSYVYKEGLTEDLKKHNKDGYLERQAFLERVDQRTFEAEREERLKRSRSANSSD